MFGRRVNILNIIVILGLIFGFMLLFGGGGRFLSQGEASVRSKTSRVRADMRIVAIGLRDYRNDHGQWPAPSSIPGDRIPRVPLVMTTPVAYVSYLMADPFQADIQSARRTLAYVPWQDTFVLLSFGPDRLLDTPLATRSKLPQPPNASEYLNLTYDPTNGLRSSGDLFRWHEPETPTQK